MRILVDINHPAHVHLYRHFIREMEKRGHQFWITVKNDTASKQLLELYNFPFIEIGDKSDSIIGKSWNQIKYNNRLRRLVKENEIDIGIGTSVTVAHISKISCMKSVVFDDDDDRVEPLFTYFVHPFSDYLISPDALQGTRRKKDTVYFAGYHELAYLHPNRFQPDPGVLTDAGVKEGEDYFILRFNAFKAHHDSGVRGLSQDEKKILINKLKHRGKILITTERDIDKEYKEYHLNVSPDKIHSLLYYAKMFVGDSQTMTSEAAVLGTPALKCNTFAGRLSIPNELEKKYKLCFSFQPFKFTALINKIDEFLKIQKLEEVWQENRMKMLKDKIDVPSFMVWFIENLPKSAVIIRNNPDFQLRFT